MAIVLTVSILPTTFAFAKPVSSVESESSLATIQCVDDVYYIYEADELNLISKEVRNGNSFFGYQIKIMQDLDFEKKQFLPIGDKAHPFRGNFDGCGHTINNIRVYTEDGSYVGLFGYVGPLGIVRNLILGKNVSITGNNYTGGIVGYNNGIVTHCCFKGNVICNTGNRATGGIVGYNACEGYISDCRVSKSSRIVEIIQNTTSAGPFICGRSEGSVSGCKTFAVYPW